MTDKTKLNIKAYQQGISCHSSYIGTYCRIFVVVINFVRNAVFSAFFHCKAFLKLKWHTSFTQVTNNITIRTQ